MKKYAFILALTMAALLVFTACSGNGDDAITPPIEQDDNGYVETPNAQGHEDESNIVTPAHVQLQLVDNESVRQWYMGDDLFDLSQAERYHEFDTGYDFARVVFTTGVTVRDFRFLNVQWNDNFSPGVDDRLYFVRDVLYTLDELTPEIPFVVTGADMGSALAANGFSFVDETGQLRYFAFLIDGMTGLLVTMEFFDSPDEQQEQAASEAPEEALHQYANEWVTITAGLGGGISISIPPTWQSYEHIPAPDGEPFRGLLIYGEGIGGLIELSIHESPISRPSMILDGFTYQDQFQFNDGHIGYMAEDYSMFVWIHDERGILDIYFRHGGNRELFSSNEYLILNIVSSLRYNQ